jgi:hypothetical protein
LSFQIWNHDVWRSWQPNDYTQILEKHQ